MPPADALATASGLPGVARQGPVAAMHAGVAAHVASAAKGGWPCGLPALWALAR